MNIATAIGIIVIVGIVLAYFGYWLRGRKEK